MQRKIQTEQSSQFGNHEYQTAGRVSVCLGKFLPENTFLPDNTWELKNFTQSVSLLYQSQVKCVFVRVEVIEGVRDLKYPVLFTVPRTS